MRDHKYGQDPIGQMKGDLGDLRRRVKKLQNRRVTTVPLYDQAGYLTGDAVEGQVIVDTTGATPIPKFRQNGQWWTIAGLYAMPTPVNAQYHHTVAQSIAKQTPTFIDFTVNTSFTDSTPLVTVSSTWITVNNSGMYSIDAFASDMNHYDATKFFEISMWASPDLENQWSAQGPLWANSSAGVPTAPQHGRSMLGWFNAGDIFAFVLHHDYTATATTDFLCNFWIEKLEVSP